MSDTQYQQALQSIADAYGVESFEVAPVYMGKGEQSILINNTLIGTLSYELNHHAPNWDMKCIKVDWTFKSLK